MLWASESRTDNENSAIKQIQLDQDIVSLSSLTKPKRPVMIISKLCFYIADNNIFFFLFCLNLIDKNCFGIVDGQYTILDNLIHRNPK